MLISVFLAAIVALFAMPFGAAHAQVQSSAARRHSPEALATLTVCEVLENLGQHAGQMVAVVGRLSTNPFDGAWLSENGCSSKVLPSDANWPYTIFLGCFEDSRPHAIMGRLNLDRAVLDAKLDRLRKTTKLEYYYPLVVPTPGQEVKKVQRKETWSVVFGRLKPSPPGIRGAFGAVRAQAQLCSGQGATLDIEEPDLPRRPQ
jgi:hypothetical protein